MIREESGGVQRNLAKVIHKYYLKWYWEDGNAKIMSVMVEAWLSVNSNFCEPGHQLQLVQGLILIVEQCQ